MAIYGVYLLHLPTPLNLILKPFGLKGGAQVWHALVLDSYT